MYASAASTVSLPGDSVLLLQEESRPGSEIGSGRLRDWKREGVKGKQVGEGVQGNTCDESAV